MLSVSGLFISTLFQIKMIHGLVYMIRHIRLLLAYKKLSNSDIQVLIQKFPYYRNLKAEHQAEFRERLQLFLAEKKFIARGGLTEVTREMQLLIAATATMVSFGFRNVRLRHFNKILVYPDDYFSTINKQYHQGEVNPRLGIIVLSWQNFVRGFDGSSDGVNLGIHEMAHALKLENRIHYNRESNFFNQERWDEFAAESEKELEGMKAGKESMFRSSATINPHEFFAVALEAFFEKSMAFKAYNEKLYKALVFLLQQDPIVLSGNRKF